MQESSEASRASDRGHEMLIEQTLASGMRLWVARPETDSPRPAVFLHHERFGPVKHSFESIEKIASDGFVGCLPDLYHRFDGDRGLLERAEDRCDPTDEETLADLDESVAYLRTLDFVDGNNIGMAGFCATGRAPILYAASRDLKGIAVFHGGVYERDYDPVYPGQGTVSAMIPSLSCPTFGAFGESDFLVSLENVQRFRTELEQHRKSYRIKIFANMPHAWGVDDDSGRFRPREAEEAWQMMVAFFDEVFTDRWDAGRAVWQFDSDIAPDYDYETVVAQSQSS